MMYKEKVAVCYWDPHRTCKGNVFTM